MNSKLESKLKMYRAVEQHGNENPTIVALNLAFSDAFNRFKAKIAAIATNAQQNETVLTGIAEDKSTFKQALARRAADIASVIYAYAIGTSNNTLKQEVNFSYSTLVKSRDNELAPRCQNIHDKAAANLADLADYGIKAADLTSLQVAIDDYQAQSPKTRAAASQRKTTGDNLNQLFKEADAILRDEMDKLIITFKPTHPDFVKTYESNRIIVDPPTRPNQTEDASTNKINDKFT